VPWSELCAPIELVPAKAGNGPPPVGAERMLQNYWRSSDPTCPILELKKRHRVSTKMRQVFAIDLGPEPEPDETTHTSRSGSGWTLPGDGKLTSELSHERSEIPRAPQDETRWSTMRWTRPKRQVAYRLSRRQ
jgi:hypothetical protein